MKKIFQSIGYFFKNITLYDIVILVILTGLLVLTVFNFSSHRLFINSVKEFADSVVYYFKNIFSIEEKISKENVSFLTFDESIIKSILPIDIEAFGYRFLATFEIMTNGDYEKKYWANFLLVLSKILNIVLILIVPLIIIIMIYYNFIIFKEVESKADEESKPLKVYKKIKEKVLDPVKLFFVNFYYTWRYTKFFFIATLVIALYNINIFSFAFSLIAWYLYFVFSIDFVSIWYLLCKFLICISPLLHPFF